MEGRPLFIVLFIYCMCVSLALGDAVFSENYTGASMCFASSCGDGPDDRVIMAGVSISGRSPAPDPATFREKHSLLAKTFNPSGPFSETDQATPYRFTSLDPNSKATAVPEYVQITAMTAEVVQDEYFQFEVQAIGPAGAALEYQFYQKADYGLPAWDTNPWETLQEGSPVNWVSCPFPVDCNTYLITHLPSDGEIWQTGDPQGGFSITCCAGIQITGISVNLASTPEPLDTVTCTLNAVERDNVDLLYRFSYKADYGTAEFDTNNWQVVQDWSPANRADYIFSVPGNYYVIGQVVRTGETWEPGDPQGGFNITVASPVETTLAISGPSEIDENASAQYTCIATYSNGLSEDVTTEVIWREYSPAAGILSSGLLTTTSVSADRLCIISARSGDIVDFHGVIIRDTAELTGITISGPGEIDENASAQYICTAIYSDNTTADVTNSAVWTENSPYASISATGRLTAGQVEIDQTCTITASFAGFTDNRSVIIRDTTVMTGIAISGPGAVDENSSAQYICTATYSDNSTADVTESAVWSVDSPFAIITDNGILIAGAVQVNQSCTITADFAGFADALTMTIVNEEIVMTGITITGLDSIPVGIGSAQYTCMANYSNGASNLLTSGVTWTEDSPYASIDSNGLLTLVTAVPGGEIVTITATYGNYGDIYAVTLNGL